MHETENQTKLETNAEEFLEPIEAESVELDEIEGQDPKRARFIKSYLKRAII